MGRIPERLDLSIGILPLPHPQHGSMAGRVQGPESPFRESSKRALRSLNSATSHASMLNGTRNSQNPINYGASRLEHINPYKSL